jgi:hypothetical protein
MNRCPVFRLQNSRLKQVDNHDETQSIYNVAVVQAVVVEPEGTRTLRAHCESLHDHHSRRQCFSLVLVLQPCLRMSFDS